jgi:hypothetical protein
LWVPCSYDPRLVVNKQGTHKRCPYGTSVMGSKHVLISIRLDKIYTPVR